MSRQNNRAVFLLLLLIVGGIMLILNLHTPLMMDDYDYSFSWATGERLAGLRDILASQAAHYRLWGGRSVTHFLVQLFLYWGKGVFSIANTLMYILLLLEVYYLVRRRDSVWNWRPLLLSHLLLFFTVSFFGVAFLWLDGACNYLWGTVIAIIPLLIARSEREGGFFDTDAARGFLAVPLCFLAGWTNENTACGILGAMILLIIWDAVRRRKVRAWRVAAVLAQAIGVAVMLLAPGNFARAGEAASRGFVMEMVYRAAVVSYCLLRYAGIPAVLFAIAMFVAVKKKVSLRWEWLGALGVSAFLSAYALVGSPQISDRSFTAVIVLFICMLLTVMADKKPDPDAHSLRVGVLLAAAAVCAGVFAIGDVKKHERAWLDQIDRICTAAEAEEPEVSVSSVASRSRFTMSIALEENPDSWPNSTMSKYYGIRIAGE